MTTVRQINEFLLSRAPASLAEDWDSVGIHCGREDQPVTKIMVALDASETAMQEAVEQGCDLLVTHHPRIFKGIDFVNDRSATGKALLYAISHNLAVVCHHTNLDCVAGGINDLLAEALGLRNVTVLDPKGEKDGKPCGYVHVGDVDETTLPEFAAFVKKTLGCAGLRYADGGKPVRRVAVGGGACGFAAGAVNTCGCDTFVTADLGYHEFCNNADEGISMIDAGHFQTENLICPVLAGWLRAEFPSVPVLISEKHTDVIRFL